MNTIKTSKTHYVYLITNSMNGKKYIGVRSSKKSPEDDISYFGSSKILNEEIKKSGKEYFKKEILSTWNTRQEANKEEIRLHKKFNVSEDSQFYNKANATEEGFCTYGQVPVLDLKTNETKQVTIEEFLKNNNLITKSQGRVSVLDLKTNETKQVTKEEFEREETLVSVNKGLVSVIDSRNNSSKKVSIEEYKKYDYLVSTTCGKVVMFDRIENRNKSVSIEEAKDERYVHYLKNQVLVSFSLKNKFVSKEDFQQEQELVAVSKDRVLVIDSRDGSFRKVLKSEIESYHQIIEVLDFYKPKHKNLLIKACETYQKMYFSYEGNKGNFHHRIKKKFPRFYYEIIKLLGRTFNEKIYCFLNGLKSLPSCLICNSEVSFKNLKEGFKSYCSAKCSREDPEIQMKRKNTMKERYGVETASKNKDIAQKISSKNKILFSPGSELKLKCEETLEKRYGVKNPMDFKEFKEKISNSFQSKSKDEKEEIIQKRKKTSKLKYGIESFVNIEKRNETLLKKYNVCHPSQVQCSEEWNKIEDKKKFLESTLIQKHPLKIARDFGLAFSTVYNYINRYDLKHLVRKTFKAEEEINEFVKNLGFETETNNRSILNGKEIDIFVPGKNFAIEHDGLFWHSVYHGKDENYHLSKTEIARDKGIELFHVFEREWMEKQEIVKSMISSKLGIFENKKETEFKIEMITDEEVELFLNNNSLRLRNEKEKYHLAILTDEKIRTVLSFLKNNDEIEIIDFCSELFLNSFKQEESLFNFLLKEFRPELVRIRIDRRYPDSNKYEQLGFVEEGFIPPKRLQFGSDDRTMIWDCGELIFEWRKK